MTRRPPRSTLILTLCPYTTLFRSLPSYVKVLALCNEYDNLTRHESGRKILTPFEALTRIKSMRNAHDEDMLKRLIAVLSKAEIA